jgi:hypothetical protein
MTLSNVVMDEAIELEAMEVLAFLIGQASIYSTDCVAGGAEGNGAAVQLSDDGLDLLMCFEDGVSAGRSLGVGGEPDHEIKNEAERLFRAVVSGQGSGVRQLS